MQEEFEVVRIGGKDGADVIVIMNLNFLLFRYMVVDVGNELREGICLQAPWWTTEEAILRGKWLRMT